MFTVIISIIGLVAIVSLAITMLIIAIQNNKNTDDNSIYKIYECPEQEIIILGRLDNTDYNIKEICSYLKLTNSFDTYEE